MLGKLIGIVLLLIGLWFFKNFPSVFQKSKMTNMNMLISALLIIAGIVLIFL